MMLRKFSTQEALELVNISDEEECASDSDFDGEADDSTDKINNNNLTGYIDVVHDVGGTIDRSEAALLDSVLYTVEDEDQPVISTLIQVN